MTLIESTQKPTFNQRGLSSKTAPLSCSIGLCRHLVTLQRRWFEQTIQIGKRLVDQDVVDQARDQLQIVFSKQVSVLLVVAGPVVTAAAL